MSAQVETVEEKPPRDGLDAEAQPTAEPREGDGGGPAGLEGADNSGEVVKELEDFLYVDIDVEDSGKKDSSSNAGGLGAEGRCEGIVTYLLYPASIAIRSTAVL